MPDPLMQRLDSDEDNDEPNIVSFFLWLLLLMFCIGIGFLIALMLLITK